MMARNTNVPFKGRIQKRKTYHLQIITFRLQRAAGPYSCANKRHHPGYSVWRGSAISPNGRLWNVQSGLPGSLRLDAGELDHPAPLLGFVGDELSKVGRRAGKRCAAEVS
jgi:hypothetical protein